MAVPTLAAMQHKASKRVPLVIEVFLSLRRSIVFARLCESEWNTRGSIDAATLARINKLANID